jgi:iron complex outermembrane recepter protein
MKRGAKCLWTAVVLEAAVTLAYAATPSGDTPPAADNGGALEEIVVTAQKREQRLSDVGMAVTAVRGDELVDRGVTSVADLTKLEPSLQYAQGNFGTPTYTIRGVGYFDQSLAASPTVSVYQDEVAYTYPSLTKGALLDVERVEILKGPQGTLYGQNATGGAINFIAAKPTNTFASGMDVSYGRFDDTQISGFVSGPVTSTLNARLAVSLEEGGAWQKSDTRDDTLGDKDVKIARLLLDWHPSDALKMNVNLNGWTDDSERPADQLEGVRFLDPQYISPVGNALSNPKSYLPNPAYASVYPAPIQAIAANPIAPANDQAADWVAGTHPRNHEIFYQGTVRLDYSISERLGLTSLTTYEKYTENDQFDDGGVNVVNSGGVLSGNVRTVSEELRLHGNTGDSKLDWLVGANYESDKSNETELNDPSEYLTSASYLTGGSPYSVLPFEPFSNFSALSTAESRTASAFANIEYHFLDNLSMHGGIRYTKSEQNFSACDRIDNDGFRVFLASLESVLQGGATEPPVTAAECDVFTANGSVGPAVDTRLDQSNVPWRVGVDWKVTPENLVYFSVSKGFKQGASPTLGGESYIQFKPVVQEELLSYEIGTKSELFERKVQLNTAIFYYDYTNKQVLGRIIDPTGVFGAVQALVNIPKSTEEGAELSIGWRPLSGLTLNAAATYLDSRVTSSFLNYASYITGPADQINLKGESFPFTPRWSLNAGARYEWGLNDQLSAFLTATGTYQTQTVAAFGAEHAATEGPSLGIRSYGLLDLSAGLESSDGHWRGELWGRNVTNTYYWTSAFYEQDTTVRATGMPATYGISVHYRY